MMDELELLKKDWQKKEEHLPKLSYDEIHTMTWKKSSSIVKWILIISILEFTLPHLLYLLPSTSENMNTFKKLGIENIYNGVLITYYVVIIYFIFQFYMRYKEISTLDNSKELMRKIIKTRKTVKHYVIYSLSMLFLSFAVVTLGIYLSDNLVEVFSGSINEKNITPEKLKTLMVVGMAIFSVVFIAIMGGIYYLLYGLLLRKLNENYKELKQLEV